MNNNDIKKYWENQATTHGQSINATSPDNIAFEMEIEKFKEYIPKGSKVLDIGCGNGAKGEAIRNSIDCTYYGIDYSENMIKEAQKRVGYNYIGGGCLYI